MKLAHLVIASALAGSLGGCVVRGSAHIVTPEPIAVVEVDEEPPAPRTETVIITSRPGFTWIEGRWMRVGGRWDWRVGYWERERANMMWEQGRWERRGNRHVWIEGHWGAHGGGPAVRDHRSEPAPGPTVRDHRH